MTKIVRAAARVTESVVRGFAQMGSMGQDRPQTTFKSRTTTESLRGDWVRIGDDMKKAIAKHEQQAKTQ